MHKSSTESILPKADYSKQASMSIGYSKRSIIIKNAKCYSKDKTGFCLLRLSSIYYFCSHYSRNKYLLNALEKHRRVNV